MVAIKNFKGRPYIAGLVFAVSACLLGGIAFAQETQSEPLTPRYRVYPLRNITAQQALKYLDFAAIGTASQLPANPNTLLVTASQADLVKVTSIINLVDANTVFIFQPLCDATELSAMPSGKELENAIGNISIGTFFDPPPFSAPVKAIVDILNEKVFVLAPSPQFDKIADAVKKFKKSDEQLLPAAQPIAEKNPNQPEPNKSELKQDELSDLLTIEKTAPDATKPQPTEKEQENGSEDFFGKLLNSLEQAEEESAEKETAEKAEQQKILEKQAIAQAMQKTQEPNLSAAATTQPVTPTHQKAELTNMPAEVNQTANTATPAVDTLQTAQKQERRSYEPEPMEIADEMLDLNLPERLNIVDLLGLVGEYLHLDYMFDPDKVKGDVTLKLRGPIKVKELYPLLESVLKFRGFAMTRKGNLVTIVPQAEMLDIDPAILQLQEGKVQYGDIVVTRFFELQYIDTTNAKSLIDGMKLSVNTTPIPDTGTLIVTGYTSRMSRIEELLSIIDRPGPPKQFKFRPLKYTMATILAPKVKALVEQLGGISITIGTSTTDAPVRTPRQPRSRPQTQPGTPETGNKPAVYLDADERTNRILMIGFEEQLNTVNQLIDSLDVEKQDLRNIRIYDIQRVGAEEVKAKLAELGIIGADLQTSPYGRTAQQTRITRRPDEQAQQMPATAAGGETPSVTEQPIVVIIDSTNSLLVNATPEQHIQVASIIAYVDTETLENAIPYEIYSLENQNPTDLADVLTKLIQETVKDKEGKIEKVIKKEEDIVIVPDENTFSVIVYASKKNQEWIRKLITSLDRRRPQVLIDVTLVEVTRTEAFEYDLNLVAKQPQFTDGLTMQSGGLVDALVTPFPIGRVKEASSSSGTGTFFYSDTHIQALLTAMQSKSYGRILAKPKILVDDGSEGTISTIEETVYRKSTSQVPDQGGAITTTEYVPIQAKIQLKITPHISEGELLRLEVGMTREDFGTRAFSDAPPDKATSEITTTVFVPDAHTVILGGLVKLKQAKGGSKVPLLGDIPIVGALFRTVDNSDSERKLYVFLKANIVRPSSENKLADLEKLSEKHKEAFESKEREFREYEDIIPGIKPNPMPPPKVLDEL